MSQELTLESEKGRSVAVFCENPKFKVRTQTKPENVQYKIQQLQISSSSSSRDIQCIVANNHSL